MFIGIVVIFLNALGWLQEILKVLENFDQDWAATLVFIVLIIGFMVYITWDKPKGSKKEEK